MALYRFKRGKKLRLILMAMIIIALGTIVAVFIGYRSVSKAPELLISTLKDGANLSIGKIRQTATRDGRKEWSLEANSAQYMEAENKVILKVLSVTFYLEDGREVYLTADQGTLQTDTNDIEFTGNVVVKNENYTMKTERLNYQQSQRVIFSNVPVHISGESGELSADSLSYDLNIDKVTLIGQVEATLAETFAL